jgi:hypothetical protein
MGQEFGGSGSGGNGAQLLEELENGGSKNSLQSGCPRAEMKECLKMFGLSNHFADYKIKIKIQSVYII